MHNITKLFFVPVGLPGMGKSTLAKNIRLSIQQNLSIRSKAQVAASS
jgi:broad-specificity NMP kinase